MEDFCKQRKEKEKGQIVRQEEELMDKI